MRKRIQSQTVLSVLMMVALLISMIPGVALAAEPLNWLSFMSSADGKLIAGEATNINIKLWDANSQPFTGSVSAVITDSAGDQTFYSISGSQGIYSVSNVKLDDPGNYTLTINQSSGGGSASGAITVVKPVITVTGSLFINTDNTLTVKVTDPDDNLLSGKSVTIDATTVGASPAVQTLKTLNDGTFVFTITPTKLGDVNIVYGGNIVNVMPVLPANFKVSISGSLTVNSKSTITVKLIDPDGNPMLRKSVTVDGSNVNSSPAIQAYTTLNDGTFVFTMTPAQTGTVSIIYGGDVVGTIEVSPAFAWKYRIGTQAQDNVALAIDVLRQGWKSATNVILARDDQFSDAMAAVPLSKKLDAPILMTNSASLDSRTLDEIRLLGAKNVYIVGGTLAISSDIQQSLSTEFTVTRIAGLQGYDTAAQISTYVGIDATHTVYLANGHAIPDAIAISAFAAEQGNPILLTDRDGLPASTLQAMADLKASNVVLLGGTAVISPEVEYALRSNFYVKRWGGFDRYDTQNVIFQNLFNNSLTQTPQSPLYFTSGLVRQDDVSSGKPYADALVTAALAAKKDGFVAMITPTSLPTSLAYFLYNNIGYISKSAVVGNYSAISQDVQGQLERLLQH